MRGRLLICLFFLVLPFPAVATPRQDSSQSQTTTAAKATPSRTAPSAADISAAKAAHKVWVNLDTGIYHKGGRWYGKTKNGKFMTVEDAKKAGYKAAKRD
jgi:hypothetical protein